MSKKVFISTILCATAIVCGGCATNSSDISQPTDTQIGFNKNAPDRDNNTSSTQRLMRELPLGSISDLKIGTKITVIGKTNSDGTIAANRIMIGEFKAPNIKMASSTKPQANEGSNTPPPSIQEMPNRQAQRMSDSTMTTGDILKIDETSLILKLTENNSKIIFYSPSTTINFAPTTTPEMPDKQ